MSSFFGLLGAVAGMVVGNRIDPGFGAAFGGVLGGAIGSLLDPKQIVGPRLNDLSVQASTYGKGISVVYNAGRLAGNVIWSAPIIEKVQNVDSGGGKGGIGGGLIGAGIGYFTGGPRGALLGGLSGALSGGGSSAEQYVYYASCAIGICEGPIVKVNRIWADGVLIVDLTGKTSPAPNSVYTVDQQNAQILANLYSTGGRSYSNAGTLELVPDATDGGYQIHPNIKLYFGTETQPPNSTMQSYLGVSSTPAHRGLAYIVLDNFPLHDYGNRVPNFEFEVVSTKGQTINPQGTVRFASLGTSSVVASGVIESCYDNYRGNLWLNPVFSNLQAPVMNSLLMSSTDGFTPASGTANVFGALSSQHQIIYSAARDSVVTLASAASLNLSGSFNSLNVSTGVPTADTVVELDANYPVIYPGSVSNPQTSPQASVRRYKNIVTLPLTAGETVESITLAGGYVYALCNLSTQFINNQTYRVRRVIGVDLDSKKQVSSATLVYAVNLVYNPATSFYDEVDVVTSLPAKARLVFEPSSGALWLFDSYFDSTGNPSSAKVFKLPAGNFQTGKLTSVFNGTWVSQKPVIDPSGSVTFLYDGGTLFNNSQIKLAWATPFTEFVLDGVGNLWTTRVNNGIRSVLGYSSTGANTASYPLTSSTASQQNAAAGALGNALEIDRGRGFLISPAYVVSIGSYNSGPLSLQQILSDAVERNGLLSTDLNFLDVSSIVPQGYLVPSRQTIKSVIGSALSAFNCDIIETDGQLIVRQRKNAPQYTKNGIAWTIPLDDMATSNQAGKEGMPPVQVTRLAETNIPYLLEIGYFDPDLDYRRNLNGAMRLNTTSTEKKNLDFALVLSSPYAKQLADSLLAGLGLSRNTYQFKVGTKYADLEVGDSVYIETEDTVRQVIVTKIQLTPPGLLSIDAEQFDYAVYNGVNASPLSLGTQNQTLKQVARPIPDFLDLPLLNDSDNYSGFYFGSYPSDANKRYVTSLLYQVNTDNSLTQLTASAAEAVAGQATTALGSTTRPEVYDTVNTVTVRLNGGALVSASDDNLVNYANLAYLGQELIQFGTAVYNSDGTYTLSRLLRGRKGTEWAVGTHAVGESFVLLDSSVQRIAQDYALNGVQETFLNSSYGVPLYDSNGQVTGTETTFTNNNAWLLPYSPVQLAQSGQTLTWVRRTRIGGNLTSGTEVSLGETSESYTVQVLNSSGAVVATHTTSAPSFTYTKSAANADFNAANLGNAPASVTLRVAQNSSVVGPGRYSSISFALAA